MFPASTKGGGQCFAFPDVCKTPAPPAPAPIPVPYPNLALCVQATKTADKIKIVKKDALTTKSEIPRSSGDEPGVAKGVISSTNMGKVVFKKGSSKVKFQGHPAVHLASPTAHNGSNSNMPAGAQIAPSQVKVSVMP